MSLSQEILEGTLEGVKNLLAKGAQVDVLDEYGHTPLIHATATNKADIVSLLLRQGARVDLVDVTGSNALHWAVDNDNLAISQLLLQYGADPNAYTANGQPTLFYPVLRQNKALIQCLVNRGGNVDFAKDFITTKLIGHRFELRGNSDIVTPDGLFIEVDLEGFYLEFTLEIICDSLVKFVNSYTAHRMDLPIRALKVIIESFKNASQLREFKHFSVDVKAHEKAIFQLMNKDLLLLPVSYKGHAINFIKHGDFLAKCDRGVEKMTAPIVINHIGKPQQLNNAFYQKLLYEKHSHHFMKSGIYQLLGLIPYAKLPIKHQITGNCSWANTEASVPTMLYMLLHDRIKDLSKVPELTNEIMRFYHAWLEWDKDRAIEDCLLDFDNLSFQRQKAKATLLGAVLFQACRPNNSYDIARAKKILRILSRKEFHYIVRIYANIFVRGNKTSEGLAYQKLIELCGYKLSGFNY